MRYADAMKIQDFLRQVKAPRRVSDGFAAAFNRAQVLGELPGTYGSESNPDTTPQDMIMNDVFRGNGGALTLEQGGPAPYINPNVFSLIPFSTNQTSINVLPANLQRTILVAQNLDAAANLFINFDNQASTTVGLLLPPGTGIIFDVVCPNNGINAVFDTAGQHFGIMVQAQRVL